MARLPVAELRKLLRIAGRPQFPELAIIGITEDGGVHLRIPELTLSSSPAQPETWYTSESVRTALKGKQVARQTVYEAGHLLVGGATYQLTPVADPIPALVADERDAVEVDPKVWAWCSRHMSTDPVQFLYHGICLGSELVATDGYRLAAAPLPESTARYFIPGAAVQAINICRRKADAVRLTETSVTAGKWCIATDTFERDDPFDDYEAFVPSQVRGRAHIPADKVEAFRTILLTAKKTTKVISWYTSGRLETVSDNASLGGIYVGPSIDGKLVLRDSRKYQVVDNIKLNPAYLAEALGVGDHKISIAEVQSAISIEHDLGRALIMPCRWD